MDTIKIYIDTDALSKLAFMDSPREVASLMREQGIQLVISDSTVQEILCTRDISRRTLICQFIVELLQDGPILAPVPQQIRWSSIDFAEGLSIFQPYRTGKENWVKCLLANPGRVSEEDIDALDKKRKNDDSVWNSMHDTGRKALQAFFSPTNKDPTICEWLSMMDGHLDWFPIKNMVAPEVCPMIIGCERKFVEWNPLLRCYIEQFLLAIYRYGIEPPNAASKKGPKWMDYFHGAFAGLVDVFVTNDKRFLAALKQHQQLRPEWRCLIHDQSELKRVLDSKNGFKNTLVHKAIMATPPRKEWSF
jgi:hypothetical protein